MKNFSTLLLLLVLFQLALPTFCFAGQVTLTTAFGNPVVLQGKTTTNYLKVGLKGFHLENDTKRTSVNVAIVLDRSGSMSGSKLENAKKAAMAAIERLSPEDIVSIIAYDTNVEILVPATKARDKEMIRSRIQSLTAGSNTALFAGVSKGAAEIRKFINRDMVNRVILLSDGLANEGPSSPSELAQLGKSLVKEGISVSTFGLGLQYNEDLMTQLASESEGNHAFIESPGDLLRIFNLEFGDVLSVVAQEITINIECRNFKPTKILGRDAEIRGNHVYLSLNQLYSDQIKEIILESEIPATADQKNQPEAKVTVTLTNMVTHHADQLSASAAVSFTDKPESVLENEEKQVMVVVSQQVANQVYKEATMLRDRGQIKEARATLVKNKAKLEASNSRYKSNILDDLINLMTRSSENLDESSWQKERKTMRQEQYRMDKQQKW
jgi:Ca-activated chloride channel family protein